MRTNRTTAGLIVAALFLIVAGLYYFLRDTPEPPVVSEVDKPAATGDELQYLGTGISETKDGKIQWELNADQIQAGADKKNVTLIGLRAKIYETGGQGDIQLTADQGHMDAIDKVLTLHGDIKAISSKGAEFAGNVMKWFMQERRFTSEGNIHFQQNDITIMGDNLEADQNLNTIRVTGNARAEMRR